MLAVIMMFMIIKLIYYTYSDNYFKNLIFYINRFLLYKTKVCCTMLKELHRGKGGAIDGEWEKEEISKGHQS
jgi:hypothetical protein